MSGQEQLPSELTDLVLEVARRAQAQADALHERLMHIHDAVLGQDDDEEEE